MNYLPEKKSVFSSCSCQTNYVAVLYEANEALLGSTFTSFLGSFSSATLACQVTENEDLWLCSPSLSDNVRLNMPLCRADLVCGGNSFYVEVEGQS